MMKKLIGLMMFAVLMQSCLDTRDSVKEVEEKQQLQKQVGSLQRSTADVNSKFQENDDAINKLSARVDVVDSRSNKHEDKMEKALAGRDQKIKELSDKLAVHQDVMTKMDAAISALQGQVAQLSEEVKRVPAPTTSSKSESGEKGEYKAAEDFFEKKQWQDAAISFEKYRKANPKGKHAAEALYKIGVSFQEMGSKEEAKVFYKDVMSQYPNSTEYKKASTRLKGIK
jgi:TolA-binding protein